VRSLDPNLSLDMLVDPPSSSEPEQPKSFAESYGTNGSVFIHLLLFGDVKCVCRTAVCTVRARQEFLWVIMFVKDVMVHTQELCIKLVGRFLCPACLVK